MRDVKYTIILEIETTIDSIKDLDINALLNGCKYLHISGYFFTIKKFIKKVKDK